MRNGAGPLQAGRYGFCATLPWTWTWPLRRRIASSRYAPAGRPGLVNRDRSALVEDQRLARTSAMTPAGSSVLPAPAPALHRREEPAAGRRWACPRCTVLFRSALKVTAGNRRRPRRRGHSVTTILPWTWRPALTVTASRIFSTGKTAAIGTVSWPATIALVIRSGASGPASAAPVGRTPPGGVGPAATVEIRS